MADSRSVRIDKKRFVYRRNIKEVPEFVLENPSSHILVKIPRPHLYPGRCPCCILMRWIELTSNRQSSHMLMYV